MLLCVEMKKYCHFFANTFCQIRQWIVSNERRANLFTEKCCFVYKTINKYSTHFETRAEMSMNS